MFHRKIAIRKQLYEDLAAVAREAGYASTDELILHVLEREVANRRQTRAGQSADAQDRQIIDRQLRGLGYIE